MNDQKKQIEEVIASSIYRVIDDLTIVDKTEYDTPLYDLGLDSLDEIELIMSVEKELDVTIDETKLKDSFTVNKLVELVIEKKQHEDN